MDKQEFKQKAKKSIDNILVKINDLEIKKNNAREDVKDKYHERIEELKAGKEHLLEKYNWLIESADEKWEESKISFTNAFDSFNNKLADIAALIKKS
jgi:DNA-binding transcriptional regulator GbsR (MarR family)